MKFTVGKILGAATAVASATLLTLAPTAAAGQDSAERAEYGTFYVYQHDDYKGKWAFFEGSDSNLTNNYWVGGGGSVNDGISSVKNWSSRTVVLHQHAGYNGRTYLSDPGDVDKDLSNNGMDNNVSSVQFR
ncbi:peptidase inhibitor family I36 protein [Streptomyces sp. O3]